MVTPIIKVSDEVVQKHASHAPARQHEYSDEEEIVGQAAPAESGQPAHGAHMKIVDGSSDSESIIDESANNTHQDPDARNDDWLNYGKANLNKKREQQQLVSINRQSSQKQPDSPPKSKEHTSQAASSLPVKTPSQHATAAQPEKQDFSEQER